MALEINIASKRNYKEASPKETIINIRDLVGKVGLVNYESNWNNPHNNIYSCRVQTFDQDGGAFGTNGKGTSKEYALASAWAEFIERIQNGFLLGVDSVNRVLLNNIKKSVRYIYFPDERYISEKDFYDLPENFLNDIFSGNTYKKNELQKYFKRIYDNEYHGLISVPFYNYKEGKVVYLPINILLMLTGSNGMAAGNTIAEASFQALCEIFERYAASIIYFQQITPPSIDIELVTKNNDIISIVNEIKSKGYNVIFKDFSANLNLPVVGVIILDEEKGKYRLNVGSDTSIEVALLRVLTEVYQGYASDEKFEKLMLDVPQHDIDYFINDDEDSLEKRRIEFQKFIINGLGVFPYSLFKQNNDYSFKKEVFTPKQNYQEEVKYLSQLINSLGFEIFFRNTSFLGFPTVYIYVTNMSIRGAKNGAVENINFDRNILFDKIEDVFFPFYDMIKEKDKILSFINIINILYDKESDITQIKMKELLKLEFEEIHYWNHIPVTYFMTLLYFMVDDIKNAIKFLKLFMKSSDKDFNKYYLKVLNFFELLEMKKPIELIEREIEPEIVISLKNPFSEIDVPNCPNCNKCGLYESCLTKNKLGLTEKILFQNKNYIHKVNQIEFSNFK